MLVVNVPKVIRDKLGEEGADALVELMNQVGGTVATKADIVELEKKIAGIELSLEKRISGVETTLRKEINSTFKWNIVFWITVLLSIFGTAIIFR
jgi:hypothetical protein